MKITLIPSTVGGGEQHQFASSTLVNDTIAVDAGVIGFYRSAVEQARIRHVFISHTHIDHLGSLPIFVENAYEGKAECITVYASRDVLQACRNHLFNDRLWPDFVALSRPESPFLRLAPFEPGESIQVDGVRVSAVALDHVVPTVGYVLADEHAAVGLISDTAPSQAIWDRINAEPNLKAVFLEATFPNELGWLADVSKHLTPALFAREVEKLQRRVPVIAIHLKARFRNQVMAELRALGLSNVEVGQFEKPYCF